MKPQVKRRLPIGAELINDATHFRVWAPKRQRVDVVLESGDPAHRITELERDDHGYFAGLVSSAKAGSLYRLRLDGGDSYPDPASRYQPQGPHGPSQVIDPSSFQWTDGQWGGADARRQVIYELHVGTFTEAGTWQSAANELSELAGLGVTLIEILPIAEFPGRFGWGYDGVDLFAPYHGYGSCDDFRAFVDRAHAEGIAVVLDVVYNHFGPDGNYLRHFSDSYFTSKHVTDWGDAINYDGEHSAPVRELATSNASHWIEEYHLDGLRLDATDNIYDTSEPHVIAEIARAARSAAGRRTLVIIAENEAQQARLVRDRKDGGFGLDMVWSDDFHHTAMVAATGRREAYFTDYCGTPQELVSAVKRGYLYQGQYYAWQEQRRGTAALDIPAHRFVHFVENHDQVANSRDGRRLHEITSPGRYRALTALLLLGPQTPLLFQGQEFGSSRPFLFFADHHRELAALVRKGRAEFLAQFPSLARTDVAPFADPADPRTFEASRLDLSERERSPGREHYLLHRDLIALRQCDPVLSSARTQIDGAVIAEHAFVIRFFDEDSNDRLLVVNLGADAPLAIVPEPLLAPPRRERGWRGLWSSEDPCYGGRGSAPLEAEDGSWRIPAESATLLGSDE